HIALEPAQIKPQTAAADIAAGVISHPLDRWLLGVLADVIAKASVAFEAYEYAQALREIEDFFWRVYCDNYLELVKSRTRIEGAPTPAQLSALHTLHHATLALLRLFAPFLPYACETLNDIMVGAGEGGAPTVHARGSWPQPGDQAAPNLDQAVGELVLEAVNAVRKTKSDLHVLLRAPIAQIVI